MHQRIRNEGTLKDLKLSLQSVSPYSYASYVAPDTAEWLSLELRSLRLRSSISLCRSDMICNVSLGDSYNVKLGGIF